MPLWQHSPHPFVLTLTCACLTCDTRSSKLGTMGRNTTSHATATPSSSSSTSGRPLDPSKFEFFEKEILTPEFWQSTWEKKHRHWRDVQDNFFPEHFSVDRFVNRMLGPDCRVFVHEKSCEHDSLRAGNNNIKTQKQREIDSIGDDPVRGYLAGGSLVYNQADRLDESLLKFCQHLAKKFFHHVFCVYYLTPPGSQAVRPHSDDQDVFILQVWGKKKWHLYQADPLLIYTEEMLGKKKPVPEKCLGEDRDRYVGEVTMEAGDILYMPRGLLHEAENSEGALNGSLHFTITVPSCDYCWGALLCHYLEAAQGPKMVSNLRLPVPEGPRGTNSAAREDLSVSDLQGTGVGGPPSCSSTAKSNSQATEIAALLEALKSKYKLKHVISAYEEKMRKINDKQAGGLRIPGDGAKHGEVEDGEGTMNKLKAEEETDEGPAGSSTSRGGTTNPNNKSGGTSSASSGATHGRSTLAQKAKSSAKPIKQPELQKFSSRWVRFPANIRYNRPARDRVYFQKVGHDQSLSMQVDPAAGNLLDQVNNAVHVRGVKVGTMKHRNEDAFEIYCILQVFIKKMCLELVPLLEQTNLKKGEEAD
ncbi:unnamed protein product [Amoebophrya sp. A120]|nr:unnamed protein product [Amoebophrya sp. A120]|eukprot:GSA120T00020036001.1